MNRTFVWEIIPSVLTVALIRKGWGIAGDVPVSKFENVRMIFIDSFMI